MSQPKGLIVRARCFALYICVCVCFFVFVCFGDAEEECGRRGVPSSRTQTHGSINRMFSHYFLSAKSFFFSFFFRSSGLTVTSAPAWRLLADDRERWALLEVCLMASVSGSLSTRRIEEGHCDCSPASPVFFLLYRNAGIDIPEVLINKRTHSFPSLTELSLWASLVFLAFTMELEDFAGATWRHQNIVKAVDRSDPFCSR